MNKKVLIGIAIAGGLACILACACAAAGLFIFNYLPEDFHIQREIELDYIDVKISTPTKVRVGEDFLVDLEIRNNSDEDRELDSIDLYTSYLDGMELIRSDPPYLSSRKVTMGGDYYTYAFKRMIPAKGTMNVTFFMTATTIGDYIGPVFVCVTGPTICNEYFIGLGIE